MRRLSVGELAPGEEPTTANGRPIVGLGSKKVVMTLPKRGSIMSQEVMPEEVVDSSDLDNDEGMTRLEAVEDVNGSDASESEEGGDVALHVEHEEDIEHRNGIETLGNEEVGCLGKFKRSVGFDTWKKPRKDKED